MCDSNVGNFKKLHVEVIGEGPNLVLLHGWGLNSACWQTVVPQLKNHFRLHLIDLPGFGFSHDSHEQSQSLAVMTDALAQVAPDNAIWLGWSLGGLCASHFALTHPEKVECLITTASSPKFVADESELWDGIKPDVLTFFETQLQQHLSATINRFLAIQALGSESAKQDIKQLKTLLSERPEPHINALAKGLQLLREVDLRDELSLLSVPFYRWYGRKDTLVPLATMTQLDLLYPHSVSHVFDHSSHAPFISESDDFVTKLKEIIAI